MSDRARTCARRIEEAVSGMEATTAEGQRYVVESIIRQEMDAEVAERVGVLRAANVKLLADYQELAELAKRELAELGDTPYRVCIRRQDGSVEAMAAFHFPTDAEDWLRAKYPGGGFLDPDRRAALATAGAPGSQEDARG